MFGPNVTSFLLCAVLLASAKAISFKNKPLIDVPDFADPSAVLHDGKYYMISNTRQVGANGEGVPIYTSTDLRNWESAGYVFNSSNSPAWGSPENYYAPELVKLKGLFAVYFPVAVNGTKIRRIGVAVSSQPLGPYRSLDRPMIGVEGRYMWDPAIFQEDNKVYLLWQADGIKITQLNDNGIQVNDGYKVTELLKGGLSWEKNKVSSPFLLKHGDYYYLFYGAANNCETTFALGVARSKNILGPYEKKSSPLLPSTKEWVGRSIASIVKYGSDDVLIYQAKPAGSDDSCSNRKVFAQGLLWGDDGWPSVDGCQRT